MQKPTVPDICPECGHRFRGNGFDGIDAHWRAKHENRMPYKEAWPLIKSGTYVRQACSIEKSCGSLEQIGGPRLTIAQIKRITEEAWAGKR
jgi:hypothetical protein